MGAAIPSKTDCYASGAFDSATVGKVFQCGRDTCIAVNGVDAISTGEASAKAKLSGPDICRAAQWNARDCDGGAFAELVIHIGNCADRKL